MPRGSGIKNFEEEGNWYLRSWDARVAIRQLLLIGGLLNQETNDKSCV